MHRPCDGPAPGLTDQWEWGAVWGGGAGASHGGPFQGQWVGGPKSALVQPHSPQKLESANPRTDSACASGCTRSMARATAPSPGRPTPGVVKYDKSSGGSVDTTKTRSGPQRVRMSSGERRIGAAKGKRWDTEALCQDPPPPPEMRCPHATATAETGGGWSDLLVPPVPHRRPYGRLQGPFRALDDDQLESPESVDLFFDHRIGSIRCGLPPLACRPMGPHDPCRSACVAWGRGRALRARPPRPPTLHIRALDQSIPRATPCPPTMCPLALCLDP